MTKNRIIISLLFFIVSFFSLTYISYADDLPNNIIIDTEDDVIDEVKYNEYYLRVNKILAQNKDTISYCLEIDKEYPGGENFVVSTDREYDIYSVLQVGYPNLSVEELGVETEDEAYFATQIALWCYLEGYNANFITGYNTKEVQAIKKIYNEAKSGVTNVMKYDVSVYFTNEDVQDIAVLSIKNIAEDSSINQEEQQYNGK